MKLTYTIKKRLKMNNKKILLFVFSVLVLIGFLYLIIAAASTINPTLPAVNFTNISGSAYILNATLLLGGVNGNTTGNTSFCYQPWSYTEAANGTCIAIATTNNVTSSQWYYNATWNTFAVADGIDYTINATVYNYPSLSVNSTNMTGNITIDNTPPTTIAYTGATLAVYTNATAKKNTQKLALNISVTDATVGISNSSSQFCFVNVAGLTNQTLALNRSSASATNGYCNSSLIDLTGLADGNQTIQIYVNDTMNNMGLNNTLVVLVDTTAPTMIIYSGDGAAPTAFTNGTIKASVATNLTLNVSVTDATVGLANSSLQYCFIQIDDEYNHSVALNRTGADVTTGWCNSSDINITGLSDGNHTINVTVNDTINNLVSNFTFHVQIDTTNPIATATCSPTTVYTGDTFPCSCSTSDATSGINSASSKGTSTSPDGVVTPSSTGTFTYTCTATDNGGLISTSTKTYSVVQIPENSGQQEGQQGQQHGHQHKQ